MQLTMIQLGMCRNKPGEPPTRAISLKIQVGEEFGKRSAQPWLNLYQIQFWTDAHALLLESYHKHLWGESHSLESLKETQRG